MNTSSRYLYRYIAFCIAEFVTSVLYIIQAFSSSDIGNILWIILSLVYLFMATWRILEVTVLNRYFNSLKKRNNISHKMTLTYIPPNQSLFEANMISAVQALLISLSHIFDSLEMEK